jgi:hypothetical protein
MKGNLHNGSSNPHDGSVAGDEKISAATALDRVRAVLREQRATDSFVSYPQVLQPIDEDEFELLEFFPWRRAVHATFDLEIRDLLLAKTDESFVHRSYRRILARDPCPHEARRWIERLSGGWLRTIVVARLRLSFEGQRVGVGVRGLWPRAALALPLMFYRVTFAHLR